jgi:hypothetical protein
VESAAVAVMDETQLITGSQQLTLTTAHPQAGIGIAKQQATSNKKQGCMCMCMCIEYRILNIKSQKQKPETRSQRKAVAGRCIGGGSRTRVF